MRRFGVKSVYQLCVVLLAGCMMLTFFGCKSDTSDVSGSSELSSQTVSDPQTTDSSAAASESKTAEPSAAVSESQTVDPSATVTSNQTSKGEGSMSSDQQSAASNDTQKSGSAAIPRSAALRRIELTRAATY